MSDFLKSIPITPDMVSLWVPSGLSRAQDLIRGNHGQCYGTHPNVPVLPSLINPTLGWHLDSVDDYVDCGINANNFAMGNGDHTLSAWIYPTAVLPSKGYVIAIGNNATGKQSSIGITFARKLFLSAYDTPIVVTDYALPALNQWYHILVVYNGATDTASFYVNEEWKEDESITLDTTVGKCKIGCHLGGASFFNGYIALPLVANVPWSVAQIKNFYNATKGMFAPRG